MELSILNCNTWNNSNCVQTEDEYLENCLLIYLMELLMQKNVLGPESSRLDLLMKKKFSLDFKR